MLSASTIQRCVRGLFLCFGLYSRTCLGDQEYSHHPHLKGVFVQNVKGTVNGAHQTSDLQELLFSFIRKFVLCTSCNLPETALTVKKSGQVWHKCSACGHKGPVVDGSHRLNVFIVKEAEQGAKEKKDKKDKKDKKEKSDKKEKKEKKDKKEKKEKKSKKSSTEDSSAGGAAAGAGGSVGGDDAGSHDGDVQLVGDGAEAEADMEDVVATADTLVVDDLAAIESAAEYVRDFLQLSGVSNTPGDVASKVMEVCTNSALPAADRVAVFAAAAFDDAILTQSADADVLARLLAVMHTSGSAKGFDLSQQALLVALERHLGAAPEAKPWLLQATPLVLLNLYKAAALWEDQLLAWASAERTGPHAAVVEAAAPMLKWLETAETEAVPAEAAATATE